jgi:hypothetical protein
MPYSVCGTDVRGANSVRRKTPELALRKDRELRGCYDVRIVTPEGRTYHSSEFGDLPRTPVANRHSQSASYGPTTIRARRHDRKLELTGTETNSALR